MNKYEKRRRAALRAADAVTCLDRTSTPKGQYPPRAPGATFLAAASALPEISTGIAVVRLCDHQLVMSDIFGAMRSSSAYSCWLTFRRRREWLGGSIQNPNNALYAPTVVMRHAKHYLGFRFDKGGIFHPDKETEGLREGVHKYAAKACQRLTHQGGKSPFPTETIYDRGSTH